MDRAFRLTLIASALVCGAYAAAQTRISPDGRPNKIPMPRAGISPQDSNFMKFASVSNIFEIETSKVALRNGSSAFTKEFAKEMIADHTAAQDELKQGATQKGVTIPMSLPAKQAKILAKLKTLHGSAFDSMYRKVQIDGHTETSLKFDKEIKVGHDSTARNYAIKTLPAVRMHLKLAKMRKTMMGPTKMEDNK